ncbi:hypothetical protein SAMN04488546_1756 [Geodermatophilus poikilotrophus]|uniref:Uncharacterized protein n=1 Tax=Geodermatophilus poikilotrophus TaxID=1333667 RepID=A0A1I0CV76_9ACTN|nr:hypothetical protein SAMN04488546_1756 [Geodermatophilus poikilotrophus]
MRITCGSPQQDRAAIGRRRPGPGHTQGSASQADGGQGGPRDAESNELLEHRSCSPQAERSLPVDRSGIGRRPGRGGSRRNEPRVDRDRLQDGAGCDHRTLVGDGPALASRGIRQVHFAGSSGGEPGRRGRLGMRSASCVWRSSVARRVRSSASICPSRTSAGWVSTRQRVRSRSPGLAVLGDEFGRDGRRGDADPAREAGPAAGAGVPAQAQPGGPRDAEGPVATIDVLDTRQGHAPTPPVVPVRGRAVARRPPPPGVDVDRSAVAPRHGRRSNVNGGCVHPVDRGGAVSRLRSQPWRQGCGGWSAGCSENTAAASCGQERRKSSPYRSLSSASGPVASTRSSRPPVPWLR